MDAYLNLAERVLLASRRPLRPREIIDIALASGWIPDHLFGSRQDKTLHARLSEDIARGLDASRFYRSGPGVFFLRMLLSDPTVPRPYRSIFLAPQRRKEISREWVLAINRSALAPTSDDETLTVSIKRLGSIMGRAQYRYLPVKSIVEDQSLVAIHSFVVVHRGDHILSFRAGRFFPSTDPLYGARSIGIGGAVYSGDLDMLYESFFGIIANGIRELAYGIGLTRRLTERARYANEVRPWIAVLQQQVHRKPRVLHVVMGYPCPPEFEPTKAALSINELRWINSRNPGNSLQDYDKTSQLVLQMNLHKFLSRGSD